jgi:hypothetical protein
VFVSHIQRLVTLHRNALWALFKHTLYRNVINVLYLDRLIMHIEQPSLKNMKWYTSQVKRNSAPVHGSYKYTGWIMD